MKCDIILHDITGSFLLLEKDQSGRDSPHLISLNACGIDDVLAHQVYHRITGEEADVLREPPLCVRYCIRYDADDDDEDDDDDAVLAFVMEPIGRRCTIPLSTDYTWESIGPILMKHIEDRYSPLIVQAINNIPAETLDNSSNDSVPLFAKRGFVKRERKTIRSRLKQCGYKDIGSVQQYRSTANSTIFLIDVDFEIVFFKMSVSGRPEALFTQTLARLLPEHVLVPFRVDINDNSFFTECFGEMLSNATGSSEDENKVEDLKELMEPAINTIAEFHEKASKHVEELKRVGMEDTSPQQMRIELPEFVSELQDRGILREKEAKKMRDKLPLIVTELDMLADGKVPLTVCHGDLHTGNITLPSEGNVVPLLFDWYESSISHPFLDLQGIFERSPWLELYTEKWRRYDSSDNLKRMLVAAEELRDLWMIFRLVKIVVKRGHQLGAKENWRFCRAIMKRFIERV